MVSGLLELTQRGLLLKYVVASLFRVTWGYTLALALGLPSGLLLGWHRRGELNGGPADLAEGQPSGADVTAGARPLA